MSTGRPMRILVLYTELAPYVLAGLERAVVEHGATVDLVRWPVNAEAPFRLHFAEGIRVHERSDLDDEALLGLAVDLRPDITLCAGWIDKGYVKVCRRLRKMGHRTVMCSDTAWRGDLRQQVASVIGRLTFSRIFTNAWVTGEGQRNYALRLGFAPDQVRMGFYAADTALFLPVGDRLLNARTDHWPHRLLCVARYIPAKQHQLLCDAFAALCERGEAGDWELQFAGAGELFDAVRTSDSGSHPRIAHLGFVQAPDMPAVLERTGAFVLASSYEPWGVVVQEHACAALPLVLSDQVKAGERFLEPGRNGIRFTAGDRASMEQALRALFQLTDGQLREMGKRSMELGRAWGPSEWALTLVQMIPPTP